jgi:hypothetical protein
MSGDFPFQPPQRLENSSESKAGHSPQSLVEDTAETQGAVHAGHSEKEVAQRFHQGPCEN